MRVAPIGAAALWAILSVATTSATTPVAAPAAPTLSRFTQTAPIASAETKSGARSNSDTSRFSRKPDAWQAPLPPMVRASDDEPSLIAPSDRPWNGVTVPCLVFNTNRITLAVPARLVHSGKSVDSTPIVRSVVLRKASGSAIGRHARKRVVDGKCAIEQLSDGAYDVYYSRLESGPPTDELAPNGRWPTADRRLIVQTRPLEIDREPSAWLAFKQLPTQAGPSGLFARTRPNKDVLQRHVNLARELLAKGSHFAALTEFQSALVECARANRASDGDVIHTFPAFPAESAAPASSRSGKAMSWTTLFDAGPEVARRLDDQGIETVSHRLADLVGHDRETVRILHGMGKTYEAIACESAALLVAARPLAIVCYRAALLVDSSAWEPANDLGVFLWKIGKRNEAGPWLTRAAGAGDARSLYNLGRWLWEMDRPDDAAECFERASRNDMVFPAPSVEWARARLREGGTAMSLDEAVALLERIERLARAYPPGTVVGDWCRDVILDLEFVRRERAWTPAPSPSVAQTRRETR